MVSKVIKNCKMWFLVYMCVFLNNLNINPINAECKIPSVTTVSKACTINKKICPGDIIFNEDFNNFDFKKWQHEITLSGGGNWEFQYYTNNRSNSFVQDGYLHLKPTFLIDDYGEDFLSSGTLDINGGSPSDYCTDPSYYGCSRTGNKENYLNPIKSARIRTANSFSFKYGKLVVKAKIPTGDWLWPAIWLLPRYNFYGKWPASGEIDILESRGNKDLTNRDNINVGIQQISSTLHWGPFSNADQWIKTHFTHQNTSGYNMDFHEYELLWTPQNITFSIDKEIFGVVCPLDKGGFWKLGEYENSNIHNPWKGASEMAPFDQEFYIIINLAVGGINFFDDNNINPGGKPWSNKSPTAYKDFWNGRHQWMSTWDLNTNQSHFIIDYIKVYAI